MLSCAGYELRVFKCHSWKILLQDIMIYYKAGEVIDKPFFKRHTPMKFFITQYLENIY